MRWRSACRHWWAAAVLVGVAGCDDPTGSPGETGRPEEAGVSENTGDVPATQRIGIGTQVSGSFRPGTPVVITATARARYTAGDVRFDVVVLDLPEEAGGAESGGPRSVARSNGALARGGAQTLTATLVFPQPGYYRVVVQTRSDPGAGAPQVVAGDSSIIDGNSETLYVLIDEQGGRLTDGWEPSVIGPDRVPLYGSYGPFVARRAPAEGDAAARPAEVAAATTTRYFRYYSEDTRSRQPLPDALVEATCLDSSLQPTGMVTTTTASDGSFTVPCSSGIFDGKIRLRNRIADVVLPQGRNAGVEYFWEGSDPVLEPVSYHAGHVHVTLGRYVPVAEQRFGLSRSRLPVVVSPDSAARIQYDQTADTMRTNVSRVFTEDGTFVTVHEYGHAYQWGAIEPPASYYCSASGEHFIDKQYGFSCAYVEGFATFFSVYVAGAALTGTYYSDYTIENQTFYSGLDGVQVEGAVAGFLYDLVDGVGSPDGYSNQTGTDETWDGVTYPASFLALTMRNCQLDYGTTTYFDLLGADEMVYCLENALTAKAEASNLGYSSWHAATAVRRGVTAPSGYSTTAVRRLWKRNFYGV